MTTLTTHYLKRRRPRQVQLQFYDINNNDAGGFGLAFGFSEVNFEISHCTGRHLRRFDNERLPDNTTKVWTLIKTQYTFKLWCQGVKVLQTNLTDELCTYHPDKKKAKPWIGVYKRDVAMIQLNWGKYAGSYRAASKCFYLAHK